MTQEDQIPLLGHYVEDIVTGVKGTLNQLLYKLGGSIQGSIQPFSEDGKSMPDAWYTDLQCIRKAELPEGRVDVSGMVTPIDGTLASSNYPLGMSVIDSFTGVKCKIVNKGVHMNGCVHYLCVRSSTENGETKIAETWLGQHRLVPENAEPVAPTLVQPDPVPQQQSSLRPGGPSMKVPKM